MPRCSRCVSVWGRKKGVGIGHNAKNKNCPAIKRFSRAGRLSMTVPRPDITQRIVYEESRLLASVVELRQEKLNHEITKQELALHTGGVGVPNGEEGKCSVCMVSKNTHAFYMYPIYNRNFRLINPPSGGVC